MQRIEKIEYEVQQKQFLKKIKELEEQYQNLELEEIEPPILEEKQFMFSINKKIIESRLDDINFQQLTKLHSQINARLNSNLIIPSDEVLRKKEELIKIEKALLELPEHIKQTYIQSDDDIVKERKQIFIEKLKEELSCPITLELFENPYSDNKHTYSFEPIKAWLRLGRPSPLTGKALNISTLKENTMVAVLVDIVKSNEASYNELLESLDSFTKDNPQGISINNPEGTCLAYTNVLNLLQAEQALIKNEHIKNSKNNLIFRIQSYIKSIEEEVELKETEIGKEKDKKMSGFSATAFFFSNSSNPKSYIKSKLLSDEINLLLNKTMAAERLISFIEDEKKDNPIGFYEKLTPDLKKSFKDSQLSELLVGVLKHYNSQFDLNLQKQEINLNGQPKFASF